MIMRSGATVAAASQSIVYLGQPVLCAVADMLPLGRVP
jgi:hypothetical protein